MLLQKVNAELILKTDHTDKIYINLYKSIKYPKTILSHENHAGAFVDSSNLFNGVDESCCSVIDILKANQFGYYFSLCTKLHQFRSTNLEVCSLACF